MLELLPEDPALQNTSHESMCGAAGLQPYVLNLHRQRHRCSDSGVSEFFGFPRRKEPPTSQVSFLMCLLRRLEKEKSSNRQSHHRNTHLHQYPPGIGDVAVALTLAERFPCNNSEQRPSDRKIQLCEHEPAGKHLHQRGRLRPSCHLWPRRAAGPPHLLPPRKVLLKRCVELAAEAVVCLHKTKLRGWTAGRLDFKFSCKQVA